MGKTFDCPACGAPLDYVGVKTTQRCPYCNNSVIVPEELHPDSVFEQASGASVNGTMLGVSTDTLERFKEMKALIESGKKIEAIKLYREITGVGLVEAKAVVEKIQADKCDEVAQMSLGTSYIPQDKPPTAKTNIGATTVSGNVVAADGGFGSLIPMGDTLPLFNPGSSIQHGYQR